MTIQERIKEIDQKYDYTAVTGHALCAALARAVEALEENANGTVRPDGKWGYQCSNVAMNALADIGRLLWEEK